MITKADLLEILEDVPDEAVVLLSADDAGDQAVPLTEDYIRAVVSYADHEIVIEPHTVLGDHLSDATDARNAVMLFPGKHVSSLT